MTCLDGASAGPRSLAAALLLRVNAVADRSAETVSQLSYCRARSLNATHQAGPAPSPPPPQDSGLTGRRTSLVRWALSSGVPVLTCQKSEPGPHWHAEAARQPLCAPPSRRTPTCTGCLAVDQGRRLQPESTALFLYKHKRKKKKRACLGWGSKARRDQGQKRTVVWASVAMGLGN